MTPRQSEFWQINNVVPMISSVVMVVFAFGALMTRVAVLESKIDTLMTLQVEFNTLSNRITALETASHFTNQK